MFTPGVPPLRGFESSGLAFPRLTSWAIHFRRFAAVARQLAVAGVAHEVDAHPIKKVVTHSGDFDGTFVYTYDAWKIAQK